MGLLSTRAVVGHHCTITAMRGDRVLTLEGTIHGVTDTIVSIDVKHIDKLKHFEGTEHVILNSIDADGRDYSATDNRILFSKKYPNVIAISSVLQVAYANNRVYPRYTYVANAAVKLTYSHDWKQCKSLDISHGGVALNVDVTIPSGSKVDILVYDRFRQVSIMLEGEVRHTRLRHAGSYLVGCQCLATDDLKLLVNNLAEESFDLAD